MTHILFWFFLLVAAGNALAGFVPAPLAVWLGLGLGAAAAAVGAGHRRSAFFAALALSAVFLGAFARSASILPLRAALWEGIVARAEERPVTLEGTLERDLEAKKTVYGKTSVRFVAGELRAPGRLRVTLTADADPRLAYGDRVRLTGTLERPSRRRNPAGFDERRYLESLGVFAIMRAKSFEVLPARPKAGILDRIRNRWNSRYAELWSGPRLGIAKALFLGERSELDAGFRAMLVRTGTMHYFAISGSNLTLLAGVVLALLASARLGGAARTVLAFGVLCAYAEMVGGSPPVVRALLMTGAFFACRLLARQFRALNALGLAGSAILIVHPEDLGDAGFLLSFAAVAALVAFAPRFFSLADIRRVKLGGALSRFAVGLKGLLVASVAAWAATAPIAIGTFHSVFLLSPLANMALAPVVVVLNTLLVAVSALALLPFGAERILAAPTALTIDAMTLIVRFFAGFDAFFVSGSAWGWTAWAFFAAGLWAVFAAGIFRRSGTALAALFLVTANTLLLDASLARASAVEPRVTFFDVGQGDAALIEFGHHGNLLVDAGPGSDDGAEYAITPYLLSRGIRRIDAVVITHPQADHSGALEALMRNFRVAAVLDNGDRNDAAFYRALEAALEREGARRFVVGKNDRISGFGPGADIRVLHPPKKTRRSGGLNEASVVLRVDLEGTVVFLTGDIGEEGLSALESEGEPGKAEIYKVPHHGARMGRESLELLRNIRPETAVIQAGRRNRYRHPHPGTLKNLEALAGRVYRTDRNGAVLFARRNGKWSDAAMIPEASP